MKKCFFLKKDTCVITDGAPNMVGKEAGFVSFFTKHVGHPRVLEFHCIIHQETLCANSGLKELVGKVNNFISTCLLKKKILKSAE